MGPGDRATWHVFSRQTKNDAFSPRACRLATAKLGDRSGARQEPRFRRSTMTQSPVIPDELLTKAATKGWTSQKAATETIELVLAKGFSLEQIGVALDMGLTPERAHELLQSAPLLASRDGDIFSEQ